ncbi:Receptor-like protein EIX2 [Linum perenne]
MEFKAGIEDPSSFLSSWVEQGDCCTWSGVVCDNFTGHVTELHLGWPSSSSWQNSGFSGKLSPSLLELKYLSYLDLSNNNFQGIPVPSFLGSMSGLSSLYLDGAGFGGVIPHQLGNLSHLQQLGLQAGDYVMYSDSLQWILGLHSLEYLDLSNVDLSNATDWLNMVNILPTLSELYLSKCQIRYIPPVANVNLSLLSALDLYHNDFPRSSLFSWASHLHSLTYLDLGLNHFANNSISGSLPVLFGEMTSLNHVDISRNKIIGMIPESFGMLAELTFADISQNSMKGVVFPEIHFANLSNLASFLAFDNQMVLRTKPEWVPSKHLAELDLGSWYVGPGFPHWLQTLEQLMSLDLFNSGISEPIPEWFWNMSSQFYYLNFSHNQIPGKLPHVISVNSNLSLFDFSFNCLEGPMPLISSNLTFLDLSNNLLSGKLLKFLCFNPNQMKEMEFLNLQGNHLTGEIPNCWKAWQRLKAIKLGSNKFSGKIPNSIGYLSNLKSLRFQNLSLTGEIPPSLGNCSRLVSVDLSQNDLEGNIPEWMGQSLPALSILSLGSNKFHGTIPEELCNLQSLQILDLSHNYLNGTLPECVANLTAMVSAAHNTSGTIHLFAGQSYSFPDSQLLVTKGQLLDYSTILNYVRNLDLSRNNLSGEIPKQITSLKALKYLNLSHNSFSGAIPEDLTEMQSLECMDLSDNQLSGAIPSSLGSLTFLNHLNLSYNNLGGRIPSSTQLQSFDSSSFTGNRELCGPPLGLNCSIQSGFKDGEEDDKEFAFHWSSGSVFIGFVAGFWAVVGTFVLNQESRKTYFEFVDLMGNKLWNVLIRWLK